MKQPETKFKEKVLKDLRSLPETWWVKVQQVAIRGTPDILGTLGGVFVAIELKSHFQDADPLQRHNLDLIADAGGIAVLAYPENWEETFAYLRGILAHKFKKDKKASNATEH